MLKQFVTPTGRSIWVRTECVMTAEKVELEGQKTPYVALEIQGLPHRTVVHGTIEHVVQLINEGTEAW